MSDTIVIPKLPDNFRTSAQLFETCLELGERYRDLRETPESRRGEGYSADKSKAAADLLEANAEFDYARKLESYVRDMTLLYEEQVRHDAMEQHRDVRGPLAAFVPGGEGYRTAGQMFVESSEYQGGQRQFTENQGVEVRNLLTGTGIGVSGSDAFAPVGTPFLAPGGIRRRAFRLRDLLSVQGTGLSSVPYIRELNAASNEGGASAVSEASAKPEVTMQFEQDDAPIRKIAAWIQATMEAIDDAPTLRGYIDTRLGYMLQIREEAEVLAGGGTSPHIKGILDFTGVQTQSLGGDLFAAVGSSIGKVENVDGEPDGVAVNPLTYWAAVVDRHNEFFDGNATNSGGAPFNSPEARVWGLPAVRTRALAEGHAIVGAWQMGATLFQREGITIRTTDSHASLFISNTWVILAEERVGLAVHRPDFFVHVS